MKSLPIHLNRLDRALRAQGVVFKRHQLLETSAAAFGFHNSNEATAAAKSGALNPPQAAPIGRISLDDGQSLIVVQDPLAKAPYAIDETFVEQSDGSDPFGVSPYGHILDLSRLSAEPLADFAEKLSQIGSRDCIELKLYTACIQHKHGENRYHSLSEEGVEAEIEGFCSQWWNEVEHRFSGETFTGKELIENYFAAHDHDFLERSEVSLSLSPDELLEALGQVRATTARSAASGPVKDPEPVDPWADHPVFGSDDWRTEVANGDTRQSYAQWVASRIEQQDEHTAADNAGQVNTAAPVDNRRDGIEKRIYLTNGSCEHAHGDEALLEELGLRWSEDDHGDFYPLTDNESRFIAEEGPTLPNGYWPNMAYSFLYQGKKFAGAVMEVYFGDDVAARNPKTGEETLREVRAYVSHIAPRIEAIGGHIFVVEDDGPGSDRHTIEVLIPFSHISKHAEDFDDWKCQLARLLMPAGGPRVIARFHGGVIQGGRWLSVEPPGESTWDVTPEIISVHEMTALAITDDDFTSENFALAKSAPQWIREWIGPFRIEVQEQIRAYFHHLAKR